MTINTSGAPTSKTPGNIGDHLVDSITGKVYECISVNTYGGHDAVTFKQKKKEYVWKCIGDDPNYGQNTGSGLPTGGTPYQQLVTDGNGNTVWEDRLAYDDSKVVVDDGEGNQLVKVADEVPSWASVDAPTKVWMSNGMNQTVNPADYVDFGNGSFLIQAAIFVTTDNLEVHVGKTTIVFPKKGVYFAYVSDNFYTTGIASADSDKPEIEWDGDVGVIKKLDEKFLPEPLILYVHEKRGE